MHRSMWLPAALVVAGLPAVAAILAGASPPAAPPPAYEEAALQESGAVSGVVRLVEPPPKKGGLPVKKDREICGDQVPIRPIVRAPDGGLGDVVISIEGISRGKAIGRSARVRLDNQGCQFVPRVVAMAAGQKLEITNSDPIVHIAHAYDLEEITLFTVNLPVQNLKIPRVIERPGVLIFRCDAGHPWTKAWVHVFAHPYFAVTDAKGAFRIEQVPAGTWRVRAWHEDAGTQVLEVAVPAGAEAQVAFDRLAAK